MQIPDGILLRSILLRYMISNYAVSFTPTELEIICCKWSIILSSYCKAACFNVYCPYLQFFLDNFPSKGFCSPYTYISHEQPDVALCLIVTLNKHLASKQRTQCLSKIDTKHPQLISCRTYNTATDNKL